MAVVLLLVIVLHIKLHEKATKAFREWRAKRRCARAADEFEEARTVLRIGYSSVT